MLPKSTKGENDMEQLVIENVVENVVLPARKSRRDFKEQAISRIGKMRINNLGSLMIVDEYNNSTDVWVRFPKGNLVKCTWNQFISGCVKNVHDKSVYGVGYIGEGFYKHSINGTPTKEYKVWIAMMQRCYSKKFQEKHPTYVGAEVHPDWHSFQVFAHWYNENYYEIDNNRMDLDKDILHKGNKLYSPETCVIVPHFINNLFVKRDKDRGNLPIGVKECSRNKGKYEVRCNDNRGNRVYLGRFDTPEKGFQVYKNYKEKLIKEIAVEFKGQIPDKLYHALINYTVDIND